MKKLVLLGESKFDKLRRISLIKPIADDLGMKEGDHIVFFMDEDGDIILRKKPENMHIVNTHDESLSPEHQKLIDDAIMTITMEFFKNPKGAKPSEQSARKIIESFPEENRLYLKAKFQETILKMGEEILNISEKIKSR